VTLPSSTNQTNLRTKEDLVMTSIRDDRADLFSKLESPATQPQYWARVADDVDWTVEGTHPLAGRYRTKQEFIEATFSRLDGVLQGGVKLQVEHLYIDGDTTIAELLSTSTTNEGAPFANRYCWVCRFDGDTIVEVRAYLDSTMVDYTILRNELASKNTLTSA
jgi:ketosteroid isomerase-like protein